MRENSYNQALKKRCQGQRPDDHEPVPDENPDLIGEALREVDDEIRFRLESGDAGCNG